MRRLTLWTLSSEPVVFAASSSASPPRQPHEALAQPGAARSLWSCKEPSTRSEAGRAPGTGRFVVRAAERLRFAQACNRKGTTMAATFKVGDHVTWNSE